MRRSRVPEAVRLAEAEHEAARARLTAAQRALRGACESMEAIVPDPAAMAAALNGSVDALAVAATAAEAAAEAAKAALRHGRAHVPGDAPAASLARSLVVVDEAAGAALGAYVGAAATARVVEATAPPPPGAAGVLWVDASAAAVVAARGAPVWEAPQGAMHAAAAAVLGRVELVDTDAAARRAWASARARGVDLVVRAPPHFVFYATGVAIVPAAGAACVVFGARRCARRRTA